MVGDSKLESQVGSDDNSVQLVNARSASTGQKALTRHSHPQSLANLRAQTCGKFAFEAL